MSVQNGQKGNATNFNNAFPSRTNNTSLGGILALTNSVEESGAGISNIQGQLNQLLETLGLQSFPDANNLQYDADPENLSYITNGLVLKLAIKALDTALKDLSNEFNALGLTSVTEDLLASQSLTELDIVLDMAVTHSAIITYVATRGSDIETGSYFVTSESGAWVGSYLPSQGNADFEILCNDNEGLSRIRYNSGTATDGKIRYSLRKFNI
tara:strand:- start:452 stop:1087 length:636 start_codon:yes stop_codon:yes gene_type:complete